MFALAALTLVGALLLSGCAPAVTAAPLAAGESPTRTITVVGRGEVQAKPDVAHSNIGVEVTAPTVAEAMTDAKARMASILDALKKLGIAEKDIQTSNFSINFERQTPEARMPMLEQGAPATTEAASGVYHVSNMVKVTIRDLDQVGAVLDAAVEAGANNVWGVYFGLDDTSILETQAREKAVADARARADSLARLTGVNVGNVIAVSEVIGSTPGADFSKALAMAYESSGGPIEAGELTFSTQIQVVYAIR
ncbi:MAG: hypothetical protein CVU38_02870 [Chloroflexi bacterium HGW-Chloroflexi-1]|nr:MAG: hypothetical protein CVU38_02870 [Chloroflexi bacterium HGW-Chloroflexi-1]